MPIVPIKTRTFTDPIDPELLLFIDARYIESYDGGLTASNLAMGNVENTGDGVIRGNVTYDTEEGGCFIMNGGFIDFTPSSITLESGLGTGKGTNDLQISNRDNWSISAFVKPTRSQQAQYSPSNIFDTSSSGSSPFSVYYGAFGKSERFGFGGGFFDTTDSSRTYPINEWYHVVWTKQKISNQASVSHRYRLYINGVLQDDTGPRYDGGQPYKICRVGFGFRGKIAQVKIFNKTLSAAQVIDEFSSARVKLSSIGTKKVSSDVILYLAERGTSAGWGDNSIYSNGARFIGSPTFDDGLVTSGLSQTNYTLNNLAIGNLRDASQPGNNFTISVTFEPYGINAQEGIGAVFARNFNTFGFYNGFGIFYGDANSLNSSVRNRSYIVFGNSGPTLLIPTIIPYFTKVNVTATWNGSTMKIFLNGNLSNSLTPSSPPAFNYLSNSSFSVGGWNAVAVGSFPRPFNGKIYNVILHNRTLSDDEVKELYHRMPSSYKSHESSSNQTPSYARILYVDGAEPKSYYAETGGLTFKDLSGFSRNGTLSRANRLQSGTPKTGTYPEFKKFNGGYFSFNGFLTPDDSNPDQKGNSYISFSNPGNFLPESGNPSTIIAWARASASGLNNPDIGLTASYIFSYGTYNATGQNRYVGIKYPDKFSIGGGGASSAILDVDGMIPGQWFQIAFVYISGEMRLFVNGILKEIKSYTLLTNIPFTSAHIGRGNTPVGADTSANDGYFYGDIAQVIVYDRALNEQEIYQHYKATYERFRLPRVTRPTSIAVITNPSVTTISIQNTTLNSAKSGVIINFDGNTNIQSSGILYRLSTQTGTFEWNGPGVTPINGSSGVLVDITGLSPNTSYQVRGYAWNGSYYGYGVPLTFTTLSVSVLTVVAVTASFTGLFATASGQVTDLGGNTNYIKRGFVWSNSTINVSTADNITTTRIEEVSSGPPDYSNPSEIWKLRIQPLLQTTTYYLRAFAKTQTGNYVYSSNELVFTTYTFATINVTIPTATGDILSTTANITGNLLNTGGTTVTQRGIVWSTNPNPTIDDSETNNGPGGLGSFVGQLNGLSAGTLYYVRAYAINSAGIAYSTQASFTTDGAPVVTTVGMTYNNLYRLAFVGGPTIKQSATASGSITNINGSSITEVGVVWSTLNTNIDINTNQGKVSLTTGITNNFNVKIPDLTINTLYYFRAYAVNSVGVSYGTIEQFKTLGASTTTGLPTVTRVSIPSEINSPGSVTLRAFVDKTAFGNSDFYGEPLTVGFLYALPSDPNFTRVVVDTNYLLSDAQSVPPGNYFTTNLTLPTGFSYIIRAFSQFKGYPFDVVGESTSASWNLGVYNIPTLTTRQATSISFSGAQSGGDISSDGGDVVISRGVVWTTDDVVDPVYPGDSNIDLSGSGVSYNAAMSGLEEGATYYYRAFARNNTGVGYGNKRSLTTTSRVPAVTNPATSTDNSATLNGTTAILELGGYADIDEVGFYWSTVQANLPSQPAVDTVVTTTAIKVVAGTNVQPSNFSATITSLTPGVTYYYVAYTKNPAGTFIGLSRNFSTTSVVKSTVLIGSQGTTTNTSIQIDGSNVTNAGGGTVTARGVCWSTSQLPVLGTSNFTSDGSGLGTFNSSITGLVSGTTYYIRAYATNQAGTNYSSTQLSVTIFTIATGTVQNSFSNKLDVIGSSIDWDTPAITARGVVWSTSQNPTVALTTKTSNGTGTGTFDSPNVQILSASTTYYIRAYATNENGTYYGDQITFTTLAHPQISNTILNTVPYQDTYPAGNFTYQSKYYNYSFSTLTYQGFRVTFDGPTTRLSNLWSFGFVRTTTQPPTVGSLTASTLGSINVVRAANLVSRLSTEPNNIYGGPSDVSPDFRPWYYRTYITDGVNTVYSNVIKQVHLPKTTSILSAQDTQGTATIQLRIDTMKPPGDTSPVISNHGVTYFPINTANQVFSPSGVYYNVSFNSAPTLNAQNTVNIVQDIRLIPVGSRYVIMAWVEYTNPVDGLIRIHSQRAEFTRPVIVLAAITTGSSGGITTNSATITGSNLTTNGGGNVTAGVCWGTSINPTITGSKTTNATIIGTFNSSITGLAGGTLYYVRAYVTNETGTSYGAQISFTTTSVALSVELLPITDLVVDSTLNNTGVEKAKITMTFRLDQITGSPDTVGVQWSNSNAFPAVGLKSVAVSPGSNTTFNIPFDNTVTGYDLSLSSAIGNAGYFFRSFAQKTGLTTFYQSTPFEVITLDMKITAFQNVANKVGVTWILVNPGGYSISQIEFLYSSTPIILDSTVNFTDTISGPYLDGFFNDYTSTRTYTTGWYFRLRLTINPSEGLPPTGISGTKIYSRQITLS